MPKGILKPYIKETEKIKHALKVVFEGPTTLSYHLFGKGGS